MGHKKNLEEKSECNVGNSEIFKQRIIEKEPETIDIIRNRK